MVDQLSKGDDDGTRLGQSSSDKLSFYKVSTPIVRPTTGTAVVTTVAVLSTVTTAFAFATSSQANAIVTLVNSIKTNLDALGLQG